MKKRTQIVVGELARFWYVFVALAVFMSFGVIMLMGMHQAVWFDEEYSIILAQKPVGQLLALTAVDAHPPFYYLLLKAWGSVFGWSEIALRSLSAVLMALAVGGALVLVRRLFTRQAALSVLPFVVLAPFVLRYGYEIRMYGLATLIGIIGTLLLIRAQESNSRKWWVGYAIAVAAGVYTLYMTALLWVAHGVWIFSQHKPKSWKDVLRAPWVRSVALAVVLFVPYIWTFIDQSLHSALPGIGTQITLQKLTNIISITTFYRPNWDMDGYLSLLAIVLVGLAIYLYIGGWRNLSTNYRASLRLVACLATVPLIVYIIAALLKPDFFIDRYLAHIALFIAIAIGLVAWVGWRGGHPKIATTYWVLLLVAFCIGVQHLYVTGNFNFDRMKLPSTVAVRQAAACDNSSTVVVADDLYTYIDALYYFGDCDFRFFNPWEVGERGGYAPLRGSTKRITESTVLNTQRLVHLYWADSEPTYTVPSDYELVSTQQFDQQVVAVYRHR